VFFLNQKPVRGIIPDWRANGRPILRPVSFSAPKYYERQHLLPVLVRRRFCEEIAMSQQALFWILDKAVLAILIGVVSNGMFFFIMSRFRPKFDISSTLAHGFDTIEGKSIYRIKVVNKTSSPVVDIKAQLHILKNHQTATGSIWKSKAIELKRSDPIVISKHDEFRFLTYEDIENIWNDDNIQFLRFRIYARHSVSGFGTFASKDYRLKRNSIKEGEFSKGDTFEIV
jgi:hypothetical protein